MSDVVPLGASVFSDDGVSQSSPWRGTHPASCMGMWLVEWLRKAHMTFEVEELTA